MIKSTYTSVTLTGDSANRFWEQMKDPAPIEAVKAVTRGRKLVEKLETPNDD